MVRLSIFNYDIDTITGHIKQEVIDAVGVDLVTELECCHCDFLVELPPLPNVTEVDCRGCFDLKKLPEWPKIRRVRCGRCIRLELPLWPDVEFICESDKIERMLRKLQKVNMAMLWRRGNVNYNTLYEIGSFVGL